MGWDTIEYEGHHELFRDFDLWTLRHFFVETARTMEADQPGRDTTSLRDFLEHWDWICPGVFVGTNFSDYILQNRVRWELVFQLLQRAADRIAGFGEFIPLEYLNKHLSSPTRYFTGAQTTRQYLLLIGRICTLLSKHEPPKA